MLHDFPSRFTATGCDRRRRREASGRAEEEGASMAFTLYSLLQTAILCTNAVAVLHEERFLSKSESGMFDSSRCLDTCGRARLIWPRGAPETLAAADWMHHISWFYCVSRTMKLIKGDVKGTKGPVSSCLSVLSVLSVLQSVGGWIRESGASEMIQESKPRFSISSAQFGPSWEVGKFLMFMRWSQSSVGAAEWGRNDAVVLWF